MFKKLFYTISLLAALNVFASESPEASYESTYPESKEEEDISVMAVFAPKPVIDERIINAVVSGKPDRLKLIKHLVEQGRIPVDARSKITTPGIQHLGNTALMLAASEAGGKGPLKYPVIEYLICKGADINATNYIGYTPLVAAVLAQDPALVRYFISHGADVNVRFGPFHRTLLDLARDQKDEENYKKIIMKKIR